MSIYCDYHTHTLFSADAHDTPHAMCQAALERGLREICFVDHVDLIPWDTTRGFFQPAAYMAAIEQCRTLFAGRLTIRAGIEASEPHLVAESIQALLAACPIDFVLGSAHWIDQSSLALSEVYTSGLPPHFIESEYLARTFEVAAQGDFDSLGHLDLIKRYRPLPLGLFDPAPYTDQIRAILRAVIERDKAIEINTSPLRRGLGATCPTLPTLRWYKELGGEKLTIGSDAHRAADVAADLDTALDLARAAGFTRIVTFARRQPVWIPI
jgi:histidinol-phosphatase (PHP family)